MSATAELIADRGEAAAGEEFFRCRPFLDAEGATHTLRIEAGEGELLAPIVVRDVPGGGARDAISPYGYPGLAGAVAEPVDPASVDFSATGLVSVFLRHALGDPPLAGAAERNVVQVADPELPPKSRGSDRNRINRNRRAGYEVRLVPGPSAGAEDRAGFRAAYEETMRRNAAARALLLRGRLLQPRARIGALATGPGRGAGRRRRRRLARRPQRRLPPLLPQRQRRLAPARLADEEPRRRPGRARRLAGAAAQPRWRDRPRRPPRGVQAGLRQPRAGLVGLRDRLRRGRLRSSQRRPTRERASSPPTGPRASCAVRAGSGP